MLMVLILQLEARVEGGSIGLGPARDDLPASGAGSWQAHPAQPPKNFTPSSNKTTHKLILILQYPAQLATHTTAFPTGSDHGRQREIALP